MKPHFVFILLFILAGCADTALLETEPILPEREARKEDYRQTAKFTRTADESGLGVPYRNYATVPDSLSEAILHQLQQRFPKGELAVHEHGTHPRYTKEAFIQQMKEENESVITLEDAQRVYLEQKTNLNPKTLHPTTDGVGSGWWTVNFEDTYTAYYVEVFGNAYIGSRHLTTICYHHEYDECSGGFCEYQCENAGCVTDFTNGASQAMTVVEWDSGRYTSGFRLPPTMIVNGIETAYRPFWPHGAKFP